MMGVTILSKEGEKFRSIPASLQSSRYDLIDGPGSLKISDGKIAYVMLYDGAEYNLSFNDLEVPSNVSLQGYTPLCIVEGRDIGLIIGIIELLSVSFDLVVLDGDGIIFRPETSDLRRMRL